LKVPFRPRNILLHHVYGAFLRFQGLLSITKSQRKRRSKIVGRLLKSVQFLRSQVELVVSRPAPLTPTLSLAPSSFSSPVPSPIATSLHEVRFQKGPGHKSLGFSIVGGRDSPKGDIGVFVKSVFPDGQAAEHHKLLEGKTLLFC
jgi:PDZ domain